MSTQVSTWPKGLYESDQSIPAASAAGRGKASARPLTLQSAFEHAPAILFTTVFAAELAFVAGGIGVILASVAALVMHGGLR